MQNVEDILTDQLDSVLNQVERSTSSSVSSYMWFRLAVVAVNCLIQIASALWDKGK